MRRFNRQLFILAALVAFLILSALVATAATPAATTRVVTATIRKASGAAWVGGAVTFKLDRSSYTATDQFPADTVTATTDSNGQISVTLWCNAEGQVLTRYTVTLPDSSSFSFRLAAGAGSVDLAVLRASGTSVAPTNSDTYAVLGTLVDTHAAVKAAASTLGHVKVGAGLSISGDGTLSTVYSVGALDDLSDVTIATPASGNYLRFNGTNWANSNLVAGELPSAIDATKIGAGAISNTEFSYLDNVTSNVQTQLDGKAATVHTHTSSQITDFNAAVDARISYPVTSVAGRTGAITLAKADVGLSNVDNTSDVNKPISTATQTALDAKASVSDLTSEASTRASADTTLQSNITAEAATRASADTALQSAVDGKQPIDADLTAIAALSPANDDLIQRKSGAWTNRTPAQFKTDLALTKSDVGLSNVDNTSDANKPISTATQTALDAKQNSLGFTAENVANKDTDGTLAANSDTKYPSQKAVKTYADTKASASHTHTLSQVTDAGTAASRNVAASGDASATEVVKGDDSRLSDARTPTSHTHTASQVTDFNSAVDARLGERLLATVTGVDFNSTTAQNLYTVPSGKSLVVTKVVIRNLTDAADGASWGFGFDGSAVSWRSPTASDALGGDSARFLIVFAPSITEPMAAIGAAGEVFKFKCSAAQGSAVTATIDVFGYLY